MSSPLIPGMREFDRPRSGWPRWLTGLVVGTIVVVTLIVLAGFVGGVGPLKVLGQSTVPLSAVAYRATGDETVIEVAVTLPPSACAATMSSTRSPSSGATGWRSRRA